MAATPPSDPALEVDWNNILLGWAGVFVTSVGVVLSFMATLMEQQRVGRLQQRKLQ